MRLEGKSDPEHNLRVMPDGQEHQGSRRIEWLAESERHKLLCRDYYEAVFDGETYAWHIPRQTIQSIQNYADRHYAVGSFLEAVIVNDLRTAICSADPFNLYALPAIVKMVHNTIPHTARGDQKKYDAWIRG